MFFLTNQGYTRIGAALIGVTAAMALLANALGITWGINSVLPHLFYVPIVLAAFFYPRRGVIIAALISAAYLGLVLLFGTGTPDLLIAAAERCIVMMAIAIVVSFLSGKARQHANTCSRLASVVHSSTDAIIAKNLDGIITDWNGAAEELYGYTADEAVGKHISLLIPPNRRDESMWLIRMIREGTPVKRYETQRITKDARIIEVSLSTSPITGLGGEIIGISTIAHDITERRHMQQEIERAKQEWEMTFDAVPDMIAIIGPDHRIVRINRSMSERLGVEKENAKGMLCFSLVHGEKKPLEGCPHALMGGDGETHSLVIHEKRLNSDFYVTVAPLKNQNGDLVGGVHVLYDITELKRAEESLHQANKKLNMLSSITRHDILNQLMGLRAFLELAGDGEMTQENKMFIGKAEEASMAIQRQIEFTRYYQDIGVQAPAWNDVEQMIRSSASQLGLQGIDLGVSIRGMEIYADPLAEKVFYNLMENSIRHGEKVTRIAFASRIADKGLIIEYTDDGIGISEEDRKRLFSRGFGKHTGLGLFLSREILSITGITIDENGTFGKSVRFEITVPRNAYRNTQGSHT